MANGKKRKNTIFSMEGEEQEIVDTNKILEHATSYYKTLFGPSENNKFTLDPRGWGGQDCVSHEDNQKLVAPFSQEEIMKVIFSIEKKILPRVLIICLLNFSKLVGTL